MADIGSEIQALVAPMIGRRLFVCLSEPAGPHEEEEALLPTHLHHLIDLEKQGVLFGAGPFLDEGVPGRRALYILRAESLDAARRIAEAEPFHAAGLRTFTLHEWMLNEGRVSVQIDFSSQRGGLDER